MSTNTYYTYDRSHRLLSRYVPAGEAHYFSYNQRDMLTGILDVNGAGDAPRAFGYDGLGERSLAFDSNTSQLAVWSYDGIKLIQDLQNNVGGSPTVIETDFRHNDTDQDEDLGSCDHIISNHSGSFAPFGIAFDPYSNATDPGLLVNDFGEIFVNPGTPGRLTVDSGSGAVLAATTLELTLLPQGQARLPQSNLPTALPAPMPTVPGAARRVGLPTNTDSEYTVVNLWHAFAHSVSETASGFAGGIAALATSQGRNAFVETFTSGEHPLYQAFVEEQAHLEHVVDVSAQGGASAKSAALLAAGKLFVDVTGTGDIYSASSGKDISTFLDTGNVRRLGGIQRLELLGSGEIKLFGAVSAGVNGLSSITGSGTAARASIAAGRTTSPFWSRPISGLSSLDFATRPIAFTSGDTILTAGERWRIAPTSGTFGELTAQQAENFAQRVAARLYGEYSPQVGYHPQPYITRAMPNGGVQRIYGFTRPNGQVWFYREGLELGTYTKEAIRTWQLDQGGYWRAETPPSGTVVRFNGANFTWADIQDIQAYDIMRFLGFVK